MGNNNENKIAVIGDYDSIIAFRGLGLEIFEADTTEIAAKHIGKLQEGNYAIIYITEQLAEKMQDVIQDYRENRIPAIIPIPSISGKTGLGMERIRESVKKAAGVEILDFDDEKQEEETEK